MVLTYASLQDFSDVAKHFKPLSDNLVKNDVGRSLLRTLVGRVGMSSDAVAVGDEGWLLSGGKMACV